MRGYGPIVHAQRLRARAWERSGNTRERLAKGILAEKPLLPGKASDSDYPPVSSPSKAVLSAKHLLSPM